VDFFATREVFPFFYPAAAETTFRQGGGAGLPFSLPFV
jgi:hypothetical protein